MKLFYSPTYALAAHSFDTTRKALWINASISLDPIPGIDLVKPADLTREQLLTVHEPEYVDAVETGEPTELAESQAFAWDPGLWPMVLASNRGVVAAGLEAMNSGVAGSLSSGLHHARAGTGRGYCTFNGLVIAARAALDAGAKSVLILDLDAHCGGGTASLIADESRIHQIDVSVSAYDSYHPDEHSKLAVVRKSADYLPTIVAHLTAAAEDKHKFDLCLYNAGMDPCQDSGTGGLSGITREILREREKIVFDWCRAQGMPVAFVLAGGYIGGSLDQQGLVALHRLTLEAAVSLPPLSG